jgi:hypothetical protein
VKINLSTGEMTRIHSQPWPGNGSALTTAGDVLFWGDLNRRFHAFDSDTGKVLWEVPLGGMMMTSTITCAVDANSTSPCSRDGQSGTSNELANVPKLKPVHGHNAVYVFTLPDKKGYAEFWSHIRPTQGQGKWIDELNTANRTALHGSWQ